MCALRRPVAAVLGFSPSLSGPAHGGSPRHFRGAASGRSHRTELPSRLDRRASRQAHSCGPLFPGDGRSCRKPPVPCLPSTAQDAGPIPDGSARAPDLSLTGQRGNTNGQKIGDKFPEFFFRPGLINGARRVFPLPLAGSIRRSIRGRACRRCATIRSPSIPPPL
jgi:hypothetical protein